ncbi:hypothetical protein JAAARDRAFT_50975 [Jaapia argillacea MUCL 33604]|uniref:Uncharacterized protein n=1 Tax=Jaapia argillacea MUCL 33604 TaxID=933084 RepID=A0A067P865_9AGAM|nr:hypothetical protein JAAARDRAFT_50975 [Jaapia argillacea MUCL 33604]
MVVDPVIEVSSLLTDSVDTEKRTKKALEEAFSRAENTRTRLNGQLQEICSRRLEVASNTNMLDLWVDSTRAGGNGCSGLDLKTKTTSDWLPSLKTNIDFPAGTSQVIEKRVEEIRSSMLPAYPPPPQRGSESVDLTSFLPASQHWLSPTQNPSLQHSYLTSTPSMSVKSPSVIMDDNRKKSRVRLALIKLKATGIDIPQDALDEEVENIVKAALDESRSFQDGFNPGPAAKSALD